jgi:hypothetical protein
MTGIVSSTRSDTWPFNDPAGHIWAGMHSDGNVTSSPGLDAASHRP